ncbi:hypothetical protein F4781DRAFT_374871 [Annulohypoxylon bovei var. microspora]|nr:hypothetical protein F4781DRAFT_374871 [Annulohypoxylon bovei var. microspora]
MVVRTNSLSSIKRLLPQIHQPLPLNDRESRQLLESITTSFRKNLDKEHPWETNSDESNSQNITHLKQDPPLSKSTSTSSDRPTERHLHAILSHPIFAHQELKKPSAALDPFHVFDTAVSRGLMTPPRAAGFLAKVRTLIEVENPDDIRQAMAKSGAGHRVVQWMRTSGLENNLQSLSSLRAVIFYHLVPFMYAEGLEDLVWTWVARLGTHQELKPAEGVHITPLHILLGAINNQKRVSYSGETLRLDDAYKAMIQAHDILRPNSNRAAFHSYRQAWRELSWRSTALASRHPKPSAPIFDAFVDVGRPLQTPMDIAHLELHHPLTPDHSAAVEFMHRNIKQANLAKFKPTFRKKLTYLAVDTADRLKEVGDAEEVSWIERLLARLGNDINSGLFNISDRQDQDLIGLDLLMWNINSSR